MVLQGWEWIVWGVAAFVAITSLVRLMRGKRDEVYREFLAQAERERAVQLEAERRAELEAKRKVVKK
jgi:hypothetical protein